jgi:hypothetical protein
LPLLSRPVDIGTLAQTELAAVDANFRATSAT